MKPRKIRKIRKNLTPFGLFTNLSLALLSGCRAKIPLLGAPQGTGPMAALPAVPDPMPQTPLPQTPFEISARAAKSEFVGGEIVALTLEIKNISAQAATLNFRSTQKFDFSATHVGEAGEVWSYGMNKRFMAALRTDTLEAGQSLKFETVWNSAKPGTYLIHAQIKANGGLQAAPFQIVVK